MLGLFLGSAAMHPRTPRNLALSNEHGAIRSCAWAAVLSQHRFGRVQPDAKEMIMKSVATNSCAATSWSASRNRSGFWYGVGYGIFTA
jgi:hypothetical protein